MACGMHETSSSEDFAGPLLAPGRRGFRRADEVLF
jgi:hypothetical protein